MLSKIKKYMFPYNGLIKDALKSLGLSGQNCLIIVDKKKKLLGTLSDGDLRKVILKEKSLLGNIRDYYNKRPIYFKKNNYKIKDLKDILIKKNIDLIPITNEKKQVVDIVSWHNILNPGLEKKKIDIPIFIMAGGKGSRLQPFTTILPKPLIPINGVPIIEHIIKNFYKYGASDFIISINKNNHQIIKSYLKKIKNSNIKFIEEIKPLGTAGSLALLKNKIKKQIIVTNCDVMFDIDISALINFHSKNKFDITLVGSAEELELSYGICKVNYKGKLKSIEEKPKIKFLSSCGLYILNKEIIKLIPKNNESKFDFTHLINLCLKKKKNIGVYIISNKNWYDVGKWDEYHKTINQLKKDI
tara:strand:+ start:1326 stop:2399 length:1074 start_codon:yes stop_codon:yes gene_type:complete